MKSRLAPYAELVHKVVEEVIGESQTTLRFEDCVFGECALGDLLVDASAEYAKSLRPDSHYVAFIQRGNIKASIVEGPITKGSVFELLRFNDQVEMFELQGADISLALERSVSDAWAIDPFRGPYVLQVSGLQVTYNVSLPEGQRVTSVFVGNTRDANTPLDSSMYYNVIAPAYLADGGDGFAMFRDGKKNVEVVGRDQKILELYIEKHSPINISTDGRIVINY